jgi:RND family efflux transporter MFP subunit
MELDRVVTQMNRSALHRRYGCASAIVVMAVALCAAGCDSRPAAEAAAVSPSEVAGSTKSPPSPASASVEASDPKGFTTTGPLVAEQQADISPERNGRIVTIAVQIGDRVRRGQLLALLDDRAVRSASESAKARIASAEAEVRVWEAEQKATEADLRRADSMRSEKIISEENWEHVKYKLDETIAEAAHYREEKAAAEADLASANLQLEQSRIVAPFDGIVGRDSARLEQEVKTGEVLFWITAEAPLHVLFTVPESAMSAFRLGTALELTTTDVPGLRLPGKILRVSPVVDPASGSVQVVGAVVHPSRELKPGMTMQVRLAP